MQGFAENPGRAERGVEIRGVGQRGIPVVAARHIQVNLVIEVEFGEAVDRVGADAVERVGVVAAEQVAERVEVGDDEGAARIFDGFDAAVEAVLTLSLP